MAPSESRHTASRAPEPLGDDPFAELSPGTVSAAPLLHPQRQRELIEQAAGMSTRQVASLLAAAAPEVLPPCDTLRAAPPDRYTLKVSIDQECEQGLRLLKDLMSHVDPRMSWGDLVARLVRDAVARHDPRGGRRGQRRKGADSAGASPRRAPKETHAAGAAGGPAQRVGESSGRAPNRTRATGAPVAPARRSGSETSAPPGDTAATDRQNPIGVLASAAPPSQSAPNRAFGWRPCRWRSIGRVRRYFGAAVRVRRLGGWLPCRRRCAGLAGRHFGAGAGTRRVPWRRTERRLSRSSGAHDPRTGSQPPPIPAAAPHSRSGPAPRLATRRWTLLLSRSALRAPLHLFPSEIDHLLPVAQGGGPEPSNLNILCAAHHRCRSTTCCQSPRAVARSRPTSISCAQLITACATATDRRLRRSRRCNSSSALLARRSTAQADSLQVARRGFAAPAAERVSSLPPLQTRAGRRRCAHARRCRGLPSTISCRCRRSHPRVSRVLPPIASNVYTPSFYVTRMTRMTARSHYLASLTPGDREALEARLLDSQSGKCFICDVAVDPELHHGQIDVDHIVPLAEQGPDRDDNFALTHASCNRSKGASDLRVARRMAEFERLQRQALDRGERGANLGHVLEKHGGATRGPVGSRPGRAASGSPPPEG